MAILCHRPRGIGGAQLAEILFLTSKTQSHGENGSNFNNQHTSCASRESLAASQFLVRLSWSDPDESPDSGPGVGFTNTLSVGSVSLLLLECWPGKLLARS
ncbi:hypothetical protein CapIbe_011461 [Capra ibex]